MNPSTPQVPEVAGSGGYSEGLAFRLLVPVSLALFFTRNAPDPLRASDRPFRSFSLCVACSERLYRFEKEPLLRPRSSASSSSPTRDRSEWRLDDEEREFLRLLELEEREPLVESVSFVDASRCPGCDPGF